jgi:hypothetical protein
MGHIHKLQEQILEKIVKLNENELHGLTGEKDLTISKNELTRRINKINSGYLEVIEMESKIFIRQGLFNGYLKDGDACGEILFDIPDWDQFISAVDAFYKVCYAPGSEGEE